MAGHGPKELNWWNGLPYPDFALPASDEEYSLEVIAVCAEDAIGNFDAKETGQRTIEVVAKVNSRPARKKVAIKLCLGYNPDLDTVTDLAGRLKKDRPFALLLEWNKSSSWGGWYFRHAIVDNVKLKIERMTASGRREATSAGAPGPCAADVD